jgi:hypothetical protein
MESIGPLFRRFCQVKKTEFDQITSEFGNDAPITWLVGLPRPETKIFNPSFLFLSPGPPCHRGRDKAKRIWASWNRLYEFEVNEPADPLSEKCESGSYAVSRSFLTSCVKTEAVVGN